MKRKKARKTQVIGVRLTERQRFEIDLISEVLPGNPSITGVLSWAVQTACANTPALANIQKVWSTDEPDRFVRTAVFYPETLDHDGQRLWQFIRQRHELWPSWISEALEGPDSAEAQLFIQGANFLLLRDSWDLIQAHVIDGQPWDERAFREIFAKPGVNPDHDPEKTKQD